MRSILSQRLSLADYWITFCRQWQSVPSALISVGIITSSLLSNPAVSYAQSANLSEAGLKDLLTQIDAAANRQDLKSTLKFYSPTFKTTDGLDRDMMEKALAKFWGRFKEVRYQTQLLSWKQEGGQVIAETKTTVTGTETLSDRKLNLTATLTSRQAIANQQLVSQEILTEKTQLSGGNTPPSVEVKLPEKVNPSQEFNYDAVVTEPLGDALVLGGVAEKPIESKAYLDQDATSNLKIEVLGAGGLFKVGDAPKTPQDFWISSFFLRDSGFTLATQRIQMSKK